MRFALLTILALVLTWHTPRSLAYDEGEYQDQNGYPEETYPEEVYEEPTYPEESYPEQTMPVQPDYNPPSEESQEQANHMQEIRRICQDYSMDVPDEEKASYIEQCVQSQSY